MDFYHVTDCHYLSKKYYENLEIPPRHEQLVRHFSEEALIETLKYIGADKQTKYVFITGDITNDGEPESHKELLGILNDFVEKSGKKVFIITASHDWAPLGRLWRRPKHVDENPDFVGKKIAKRYGKNGEVIYDVPVVTRDFIRDNYLKFGYDDADGKHPESFSYYYDLEDDLRVLFINDDFSNPSEKTNMPPRSGISPSLMEFIRKTAMDAKAKGKTVFAFSHFPFITPNPIYQIIARKDISDNSRGQIDELMELGIRVAFTGHTHMNNIRFKTDGDKALYDITTGSIASAPTCFRKVSFDGKTKSLDVKTITVPTPAKVAETGMTFSEYAERNFIDYIGNTIKDIGENYPKFALESISFSLFPKKVIKWRWFLEPIGKLLGRLKTSTVGYWTKKENGLSKEEIKALSNNNVVDYLITQIKKMFLGNDILVTQTNETKIALGFVAVLSDVVKKLHIPLKKITGYNSVMDIVYPLLVDQEIPDSNFTLNIYDAPKEFDKKKLPISHKGSGIIAVGILGILALLPFIPPTILVLILRANAKSKKDATFI